MQDLTAVAGNPASALNEASAELQAITCPQTLVERVEEIVEDTAFSRANRAKFDQELARHAGNLAKLQMYIWNFMLAASGNRVLVS